MAPNEGVESDFDAAEKEIAKINADLAKYLQKQEKVFGCRLQYVGKDKNRYELEIPEKNAARADASYHLEGQRKGKNPVRRFSTDETKHFLKLMMDAEAKRNDVLKDLQRRLFEKFSKHYTLWKTCIELVATLDVLTALAVYGQNQNQDICFPEILASNDDGPVIEIANGYHPCMKSTDDFIPNGLTLGERDGSAPLALLTGPNMGGKILLTITLRL